MTQPNFAEFLDAIQPVADYAKRQMVSEQQAQAEKEVNATIQNLKGDGLGNVDDALVEGFLMQRYNRDESFQKAHDNKSADPDAWAAALDSARVDFKKQMGGLVGKGQAKGKPDQGYTNADLMKLSDAEFKAFKMKIDPA